MVEWFVNVFFGIALFINAALFIPQALLLVQKKHADDVSLLTFGGFCIIQILTIWHAYYSQDWLLMIGYIVSLITCGFVTILIMMYRMRGQRKSES